MQNPESILSLSGENIIVFIREYRNEILEKVFDDEELKRHLLEIHGVKDVSLIKLGFIKRALKELISAPLDLAHYSQAIFGDEEDGLDPGF